MPTSSRAPSPVGADTPGWLLLPLRGNSPSALIGPRPHPPAGADVPIGPHSPAPYRVGGDVAKEDGLPRQRARWLAMTGWSGPPLFPRSPAPPVGADTPGWPLLPLRGNSPSVPIGPRPHPSVGADTQGGFSCPCGAIHILSPSARIPPHPTGWVVTWPKRTDCRASVRAGSQ